MVLFEISIDFTRVYTSFRVLRFQCLGLCVGVSEEKDPTIDAKTADPYCTDPDQGTSMLKLIQYKPSDVLRSLALKPSNAHTDLGQSGLSSR